MMNRPSQRPPAIRRCDPEEWVDALLDRRTELVLRVCRYHHRRGAFSSPEQVMTQHLVTFVEQGYLPAIVDGKPIRVLAGECLWISPGHSRRYYGLPDTPVMRHYNLRFTFRRGGRHLCFSRAPVRLRNAWAIAPAMQQLYDLAQHGQPFHEPRLRGLLLTLGTTFLSLAREPGERHRTLRPAVRLRLNQFIVDHAGEPIGPRALAREAGLSPDYFTRLFRATYGMAPRRYLKRERMRLAGIELRETGLTVAEVARAFGTHNVSFFCRQFREVMGCSPNVFRGRVGDPDGVDPAVSGESQPGRSAPQR
ncbi:MAG: helix-turn-helix transcriptional regulator [Kiritimatiellae bacterium]|nr:helix-turn-helix transcriptional regulator [Kiritimatiellia bacterium]